MTIDPPIDPDSGRDRDDAGSGRDGSGRNSDRRGRDGSGHNRYGGRDGERRSGDGEGHDGEGSQPDEDGRRRHDRQRANEDGRRRHDRQRADEDGRRRADGPDLDRGDVDTYGIDLANPPTDDPAEARTGGPSHTGQPTLTWLGGVVSLVGLWIAASGAVYDASAVALWNNVATGGAILLLAGYGTVRALRGSRPETGGAALAALLGLWTVLAPSLLAYGSGPFVWSTTASGVAVAVLSGYSAYEIRRAGAGRAAGTRA